MPRKKSKSADMAATEQGAPILEAKLEVESEGAPGSSTRTNRTVRKGTGTQGSIGRTKAARKSNPAATADQTSEKTVSEAAAGIPFPLTAETSIRERIALLAYSYWETRGYRGGSPEEDWFRAERELLENLELLEE